MNNNKDDENEFVDLFSSPVPSSSFKKGETTKEAAAEEVVEINDDSEEEENKNVVVVSDDSDNDQFIEKAKRINTHHQQPSKRKKLVASKAVNQSNTLPKMFSSSVTAAAANDDFDFSFRPITRSITRSRFFPPFVVPPRSLPPFVPPRPLPPSDPTHVIFSFPENEPDSVTITSGDLYKCSSPEVFLNDSLIDFYLKYILFSHNFSRHVHIFTSFLFTRIQDALRTGNGWPYCFGQVRKWTKNVELFDKSFVVFPINLNLHWSAIVLCLENNPNSEHNVPKGRLLVFDSFNELSSHDPEAIASDIRMYLNYEYETRVVSRFVLEAKEEAMTNKQPQNLVKLNRHVFTASTLPLVRVPVPQQTDGVNCGVHVLNNVKILVAMADSNNNGVPNLNEFVDSLVLAFQHTDFTTKQAQEMRQELKSHILETEHYIKLRANKQ